MPKWHLMNWEQARMKLIDGQGITNPSIAPRILLLVKVGSPLDLDPNGVDYNPTVQDFQRTDWEMR